MSQPARTQLQRAVAVLPGPNASLRDQALAFHRTFDHPVRETPGLIPDERVRFRARLIAEEFFEVLAACFADEVVCDGRLGHTADPAGVTPCPSCGNTRHVVGFASLQECVLEAIAKAGVRVDLPELADGIADLMYVAEGTDIEFGIDSGPIAAEVHRANVTKVPAGKTKPLKPPGWMPPDIEGELRKQGWVPASEAAAARAIEAVDWSVFDGYPPIVCRCHCGVLFASHAKGIPGFGIVTQQPCPDCGARKVRTASWEETQTIAPADVGKVTP